jgi:hypothetical protein
LTVIAQLDLEQDPAVVTLLWDYRDDPVPAHMVPPEYENVTDVEPLPQPGYTYNGTRWLPGVPQQQAKVRESIADTAEQYVAENRAFLEIAEPSGEEVAAQVASLTLQVVHLQQVGLGQYGREQDWSEFEEHPGHDLPPVTAIEEPDEPVPLVAAFTATPDSPKTGDPVEFDATASTGAITRYDWDFGDSKGEAQDGGPTPEYAYDHKGKRTVALLITDEHGETDEAELSIQIT